MAQGPEKSDSVFDFLYVDNRRIGLYLSQFSEFGNLTNLVEDVSTSDTTDLKGNVGVVSGAVKSAQQSGVHRHYDPQWVAPLTFLEEVQSRKMIKKGIAEASIGDFVLLPGQVVMANLRVFEKTWSAIDPADVQTPVHSDRNERRRAARQPQPNPASSGLSILASLDQPIFMVLKTEGARAWSTLDPTCIIGSAADLHLKHGLKIAGKWHVIGILDCAPTVTEPDLSDVGMLCGTDPQFSDALKAMVQAHRNSMGRPSDCYGVTPLIIMREVS